MNNHILDKATQLGQLLLTQNAKVTAAESCTGGWVSQAITAVPGSSSWFEAGFVTYSNLMKQELLNVDPHLLNTYGAVSEEVARAMLVGAVHRSHANIGVAVSGIAGPTGATATKPVGTVCIAWGKPGAIKSATQYLDGDRESVRRQSVEFVLDSLIDYFQIEQKYTV